MWDAPHYIYLAQDWYTNLGDEANFIVFFPLYPILLKPFVSFFNPVWSGIILSSLFFILGGIMFYKLVKDQFSEKIAKRALVFLSCFPTSYFFQAPYTESLFLLMSVSAFYFVSVKNNFLLSGVALGLAALARPVGILLLPALFYYWVKSKRGPFLLLYLSLPTVFSVILYLGINWQVYGDPFQFLTIQREHWHKSLAFPWSGLVSSWEIAFSGAINQYTLIIGWAEAIALTFGWLTLPFIYLKTPKPWFIYSFLSVLLFSSTSFVLSTPRYLLGVFPVFVLLGLVSKYKFVMFVLMLVTIGLLLGLTYIASTGQWAF